MNISRFNINYSALSAALLTVALWLPDSVMARSEYWEQRVSMFNLLPVNDSDIVFLGNSITDGGEFSELFQNAAIKNRGISSDVLSGVRERINQVTSGKPAKIFLLIGINDVSHNLSVDSLANEYDSLVKAIKENSPSTKLYLQSVMPINNDFGRYKNLKGKEKTIVDFNCKIAEIADRYGATYIDLWPTLADPVTGKLLPQFTNDGLHLLGEGYKAWAKAIITYIHE